MSYKKRTSLSWDEFLIDWLIRISGYSTIVFVTLIFLFLLREGLPAITDVELKNFLNVRWYPIEDYFGLLPLLSGTLVTLSHCCCATGDWDASLYPKLLPVGCGKY
jgi:ABC-type phosphate transport system permease subunit